jgi:hypothetical protein
MCCDAAVNAGAVWIEVAGWLAVVDDLPGGTV